MDEKSLLKRLQNRDEKVFEEIIDRYNAYVTTIVRSLLSSRGTKEDMEEVVADAFIALWETAERINYERYSSIKAYIAVIARNKAKDRLRMIHGQDLQLSDDILILDNSAEQIILQKEQQRIIKKTLNQLKPLDWKIFVAYYYQYKKVDEIAREFQMNPQTVKTRMRRGKELLKKYLLKRVMGLMKIKISDMFDNAAEIVEAESNYNNVIDSRKIKEIVFLRIHRSRRKRVKRQCIAVLIAVLGLSVISAGAKTLLQSAGVIGINKEDVLQSQVGINIDEDKISDYTAEFDLHTDLILSENLYENGIPIAKYIVEVSVDEENKIPECYVDNGAMLIFVGVDNGGWYVDTDTSLQLNFQQKRVDMKGMETAGVLEVGYVYNGRVKWCQVTDNINSNIQLLFEEEGNYYICLRNASSDRIIITNGSINIKKTQEE